MSCTPIPSDFEVRDGRVHSTHDNDARMWALPSSDFETLSYDEATGELVTNTGERLERVWAE